jgi:signal peptidase II
VREVQATGGAALTPPERSDPERSDPERSDRPEQAPRPWARPVAAGLLAAIGAAAVLADLLTKQLTVALLEGAEPVRLLGGAVYLVHATNSGAAFSIGGSYTPFFATIAIVVIGWIGWMALRLRSLPWAVALGLVLGGAAGNLVDRLFRPPGPWRGEVVDMVSLFDPYGQVWPVFNLADSALFAGVALAVWLELTGRRRDGTRVPSTRRGVRPAGRAG